MFLRKLCTLCMFFCLKPVIVADSTRQLSTENKLYELDVGLENIEGHVMAFGDFEGDKSNDIVLLSTDYKRLEVYRYKYKQEKKKKAVEIMATLKIDGFSKKEIEQSRKIIEDGDRFECENVVAADFMNRGMVDLMVMGSVYKKATGIFGREEKIKDLVIARIFRQINHKGRAAMSTKITEGEVAFEEQGDIVGMFRGAQPMVLDFNGNRQLDLLGKKYMSENEMDNLEQDQAAQKRQKESGSSVFYSTATSTGDGTGYIHEYIEGETKFCELAQPHFSSVVDLNGDCVPDIFLHCVDNTFELWLNDGKSNFTLYSRNKISLSNSNDEIGQISFADINADGSLDMVYPVCNDKECRLEIVYNNQLPLCKNSYSGFSKECRTLAQVCMENNKFSFDFEKNRVSIPLSDVMDGESLSVKDKNFRGVQPYSIQVADFDLDGYPDILLVATKAKKSLAMDEEKNTETPGFFDKIINKIKGGNYIKGKDKSVAFTSQIAILNNIPCEKSSKRQECRSNTNTNTNTNTADMRTFERGKYEFGEFVSMGNPLNVMVYDINANGKMDLLVSFTDPNDSSKTKLKLLYNNLYIDAFFLDTIFSPGANSTLAAISGSDKTYITGFVGPTFKAVLNDKAGDYHMYSAVQVPSTSYRPLTLPTTIIGLGRTNNYISHFYAGYSSLSQELRGGVRLFEGIIPNSKLVVYPLTDRGDGSSSAWKLMLFLNENSNVLYICATFSVLMLLLTIVIFVLYKIEAGYDKREKLEQLHAINFDAL